MDASNPHEFNLLIRTFGFALAAIFYATGILKMAGQGYHLPSPRIYGAVMMVQGILMPFVILSLSSQVQMA
jgi:hypothetical protein